jgi:hypothetical protein
VRHCATAMKLRAGRAWGPADACLVVAAAADRGHEVFRAMDVAIVPGLGEGVAKTCCSCARPPGALCNVRDTPTTMPLGLVGAS